MNFYASQDYLDTVAAVYFRDRRTDIEDVRIGSEVLRLLVLDGKHIITKHQFLDYHEPLLPSEVHNCAREIRYVPSVARRVIEKADWGSNVYPEFDLAPYVDWSRFPRYDDYKSHLLEHHKGLIRDRARRRRSLVAAHGELVFCMDDRQDDVFSFAQRWKGSQLRESGLMDYFSADETTQFLYALSRKGTLVSSTLRISGRLLSVWIGFVYRGSWSGWIFTYDPHFRQYSVGHQLLDFMLEASHGLGHREFDFSVGSEDYKMVYATHGRLLSSIGRPPLHQRVMTFTKNELKQRTPKLFEAAKQAKLRLNGTKPFQLSGQG